MTIPTLMNNTNKQKYVSRLKKTYSTLAQATNRIIADEGNPRADIGGWATSTAVLLNLYKKHLSNSKICDAGTGGCFTQGVKRLNGTNANYDNKNNLILADGTQISFPDIFNNCSNNDDGSYNVCAHINVDINGEKNPNTVGIDIFSFSLKENGLFPTGCDESNNQHCTKDTTNGWGCACRVLREGAVNYL